MHGRAVGLNHVSVPARDLAESLRFYVDVLGLERIPSPDFAVAVEWLRAGDLEVHLYRRDEGDPLRSQHFGLEIDDFMAVYRRVRPHLDGTTFGASVVELPDGSVQMYVRDPAGNLVELDHRDVSCVDRAEVAEVVVLAEVVPQSEWARRSRLFLTPRA